MEKRINTLVELLNVFANVSTEQLMHWLILYTADVKGDSLNRYPFPKTDVLWAESLMDSYLQAEQTSGGDLNVFKVFLYGVNNYIASCARENPEEAYLVEAYRDKDAFAEPQEENVGTE